MAGYCTPMSQESVEIVRGVYERWGAGDFRASMEVFDPKVLLIMPPGFPEAALYLGTDRVEEYTRGFLEPWSHIAIEAEELVGAGDSVVAGVRQHGAGSESGAETEFRYFQVWSLRGGRVIRLENFRERSEAFAAAGLPG